MASRETIFAQMEKEKDVVTPRKDSSTAYREVTSILRNEKLAIPIFVTARKERTNESGNTR
jgi:hypothetical protein